MREMVVVVILNFSGLKCDVDATTGEVENLRIRRQKSEPRPLALSDDNKKLDNNSTG